MLKSVSNQIRNEVMTNNINIVDWQLNYNILIKVYDLVLNKVEGQRLGDLVLNDINSYFVTTS